MPKPSLETSSSSSQPITGRDKGVHAFPRGLSLKVNVIARFKIKPAYYIVVLQHFIYLHYRDHPPNRYLQT